MKTTITVQGETYDVPAHYIICPNCQGHGTHLMPSIREHAYTQEEFRDFSDDERDAYFNRGGMFDVPCETCKGLRVVIEPHVEAASPEQARIIEAWINEQHEDQMEAEREARIRRAEMCVW